jgi:hypothetical protein
MGCSQCMVECVHNAVCVCACIPHCMGYAYCSVCVGVRAAVCGSACVCVRNVPQSRLPPPPAPLLLILLLVLVMLPLPPPLPAATVRVTAAVGVEAVVAAVGGIQAATTASYAAATGG